MSENHEMKAFVQALPKAEIHVHLEGAIPPATVLKLAERHNLTGKLPSTDIAELKKWFTFTGFPNFVTIYLTIQDMMHEKAVSFCGKTTLRQVGALMDRAELVITADTGPLHIALALKKKTIALFGPTSPAITGPYGDGDYVVIQKDVDCDIPCYKKSCGSYKCMENITVRDVLDSARHLTGKGDLHAAG